MRTALFALALAFSTAAASAQQPVPGATLMRVTEGVFSLVEGKSIDLTEARLLLAVTGVQARERNTVAISLGGHHQVVSVGNRLDLKSFVARGDDSLKAKRRCFLDVTDVAIPQGAKATVTFRLECA